MNRVKVSAHYRLPVAALLLPLLFATVSTSTKDADADDDLEQQNLISLHNNIATEGEEDCSDCHAGIHTRVTLDPVIPDAHVAMLPFAPGEEDDDRCVTCHRSVDLIQAAGSPADAKTNLGKHVDIRFCVLCHGREAAPGMTPDQHKPFYQVTFAELDPAPDGAELYELTCSGCHRPLENSEVEGESAADIQHAIDEDEGGMRPLSVLTATQIQQIAGALATASGDD